MSEHAIEWIGVQMNDSQHQHSLKKGMHTNILDLYTHNIESSNKHAANDIQIKQL